MNPLNPALRKLISVAAITGTAILACCASNEPAPAADGHATSVGSLSGAELWAQNCVRCHNLRNPSEYSDANWEIVGLHMRIRANLTAEEHRAITEFLKSAN